MRTVWWPIIVAGGVAVALSLKLLLALHTFGTDDVGAWQQFVEVLKASDGITLYQTVEGFNHPPSVIHALRLIDFLATNTGVWFPFWVRLPAILADVGSVVLVGRMQILASTNLNGPALLLLAVAPTSVMISGFHGNTDPVMVFFLLLSAYLLDRRHCAWGAGVAFGLGLCVKIVPIIFLPVVCLFLSNWKMRVQFLSAAGLTVVALWMPYLTQDTWLICERLLSYGSQPRWWGISRLSRKLPATLSWVKLGYDEYGKYFVAGIITGLAIWVNRRKHPRCLFFQFGLVSFVFLALTPGFGVQYLAWLVPWVVGLGIRVAALHYASTGVFLFSVYTYWSGGIPWNWAHPRNWGWRHPIVVLELLAWISVVLISWMYIRKASMPPAGVADEIVVR